MQKLRFHYYDGMPTPNKLTTSPRAYRAWEESKRKWEERQETIRQEQERIRRLGPTTADDFRAQEKLDAQSAQQRAISEAEQNRVERQQQREAQDRAEKSARQRDEYFRAFWEATPDERGAWIYEYAKAASILRETDCGFHCQQEVDDVMKALKSIDNCPESFRERYKAIRCGEKHENLQEIDDRAANPQPTPEERFAEARKTLLGI